MHEGVHEAQHGPSKERHRLGNLREGLFGRCRCGNSVSKILGRLRKGLFSPMPHGTPTSNSACAKASAADAAAGTLVPLVNLRKGFVGRCRQGTFIPSSTCTKVSSADDDWDVRSLFQLAQRLLQPMSPPEPLLSISTCAKAYTAKCRSGNPLFPS